MGKKIGELLIEAGVATPADLEAALIAQRANPTARLGQLLVGMNRGVTWQHVARALAQQYELPFIELPQIPASVSSLVPVEFQTEHRIVPFQVERDGKVERLHLAIADPTNMEMVDELRFQLGKPVRIFVAAENDIDAVLSALGGEAIAELEAVEVEMDDDDGSDVPIAEAPPGAGDWSDAPPPVPAAALPPEWDLFDAGPAAPGGAVPPSSPAAASGAAPKTSPMGAAPASNGASAPSVAPAPHAAPPPNGRHAPAAAPMPPAADLDALLGQASAAASPVQDVQPLTRPVLPPPPGQPRPGTAQVAEVLRFEPPPKKAPPAPPPSNLAPSPAPTPAPAPAPALDFSEEDLAILENLERMAHGEEPTLESAKVRPAQMVASLIRLLMRKGVIAETEFLEELGRK